MSASIYIRDLKLAAALATVGAPIVTEGHIQKIERNGIVESYVLFQATPETRDMVEAWTSPTDTLPSKPNSPLNNPDHPFWYVRGALRNRERYLDVIKTSAILKMVQRNGRTYLVTVKPNEII